MNCAVAGVLFYAKHPLELLSNLDRLVILLLTHFSGIEKLLYLLLRIAMKILPELLKPLEHVPVVTLHFVVQWIHVLPPLYVPVFPRFPPLERRFRPLWRNSLPAYQKRRFAAFDRELCSQVSSC